MLLIMKEEAIEDIVSIIDYEFKEKKNLFLFGIVTVLQKKLNRESENKETLFLSLRKRIYCVLRYLVTMSIFSIAYYIFSANDAEFK